MRTHIARLSDTADTADTAGTAASMAPGEPAGAVLSSQREAFCQAYVYYANAALAARQAGYSPKTCRQQGHQLLKKPPVAARIAAIRADLAIEGCRDTVILLGKLENVYNRALEDRHYVAAARSVEIQARLAGLMPSVHERLAVSGPETPQTAAGGES